MESRMRRYIALLHILAIAFIGVRGQNIALKSNLLYDIVGVASLGVEIKASKHSSFSLFGTYNPLKYGSAKWKNFSYQPEYRYWFHRTFTGPYISVNAAGGGFNIDRLHIGGLYGKHRQGYFFGGGIGGGYNLIISPHCSMDFSIGIDYVRCRYDRYREGDLPYLEGRFSSNAFIPLGTGISFVYIL